MSRRASFLTISILVAACTSAPSATPLATPSSAPATAGASATSEATLAPSASGADPSAVYGTIQAQVEQIRGLEPTGAVTPTVIDQATLAKNLSADFDRSNPASSIEHSQQELVALGLLPAGTSLKDAVLALQSGQVAGYYSPDSHQLFVVSRAGGIGPTQRLTYAHEFTHQLQDQHFNLTALDLQATDQGDRSLGRLSLVEGDAVSVQTSWMQVGLTSQELSQVIGDSLDPAGLLALQNAPAILRETTLFPYTAGPAFVQTLIASGGYDAVNAAFTNPPASTEQILHPEKYVSHEAPIAVKPPSNLAATLGSGWSEAAQDTLGEEFLRAWLGELGASQESFAAAAGWGGDRLVLLTGPAGATVVVLETAWDTATDASEFAHALATIAPHLTETIVHTAGSTRVSVAIGSSGSKLEAVLPG